MSAASGATATGGTAGAAAPPGIYHKAGSIRGERRRALVGAYVALAFFVVFFLFPPVHMLMTSLKGSAEIADLSGNPWIVARPTLENYRGLLTEGNYLLHFRNSVMVTVCVVAITMVISVLAAFSLSRLRFWGSGALATGVFLTYLVPETLLFIPLFQIIGGMGLYNNLWAMVLIYPTLTVPFCTWIMIGYFSSIPKELDEAALIDGANHFQMLWKIFIPVALPGILAATIFAFTVSWGQFLYPMAFLVSSDQMVLTTGIISDLVRGDTFQWGKIMAGALMAALPPLLVYAFLMDYYIAGLTAGATKG
jgi:multiple sugar transport system permease protein